MVLAAYSKSDKNEVAYGIEIVHPISPESRDLVVRDQHTTERYQGTDEQRVDQSGEHGVWRICGDELADTGVDEFVHDADEEHCTSLVGFQGLSGENSEVPTTPIEQST